MEPLSIFQDFSSKITDIYLFQRATKSLTGKELIELQRIEKYVMDTEHGGLPISSHNMFFRSAKTGDQTYFGRIQHSVQEQRVSLLLQKNKQYQWLLAEAYEVFEDYLENIYASAGYKNHDFWPMRDFGGVTISEVEDLDFDWYRDRAGAKKDVPSSITNRFRNLLPNVQALEQNNKLNVNLRLAICLVEKLRHIIVHKGGRVDDKELFVDSVLKYSGLYNNGKYKDSEATYIKQFFGFGEHANTIMLLEVRTEEDLPIDIHINVFQELANYLMAYAHLVYQDVDAMKKL